LRVGAKIGEAGLSEGVVGHAYKGVVVIVLGLVQTQRIAAELVVLRS
jgi:hypothetical protein